MVTALLALFCAVSNADNYRPPDKIEKQKPAGGLVMDYAQDKQLFRATRGPPAIKRDPAYLTNEMNPDAIAEVLAGKRTVANAAWWGFNEKDSTAALQAAIDSGAEKIFIPNMDKDWIIQPLTWGAGPDHRSAIRARIVSRQSFHDTSPRLPRPRAGRRCRRSAGP